jgi:putative membrane protein
MGDDLALLNACLNGASGLCMFAAWRAIKAGRRDLHWKLMTGAISLSALFLVSYLIRVAISGTHRYPADDWTRPLYLVILATHVVLAAAVPVLVIRAVYLAVKKRFPVHRRFARWALPIWGYVSVTGVLVYVLLYHIGPNR